MQQRAVGTQHVCVRVFFHAFLQITMDQKRLTSNYPLVRCSMFDFSKNYVGPTLRVGRVCTRARVRVWALRRVACTDLTSSGYNGNQ